MAQKWSDVRRKHTLEAEQRIQGRVTAELAKLPLAEVRRACRLTQVRMAELLEMDQGAVSKIERRTDMYLSTPRSYVEALGGQLDLIVRFPEGEVALDRLGDIHEAVTMSPHLL